jgi:hypothetical protein
MIEKEWADKNGSVGGTLMSMRRPMMGCATRW